MALNLVTDFSKWAWDSTLGWLLPTSDPPPPPSPLPLSLPPTHQQQQQQAPPSLPPQSCLANIWTRIVLYTRSWDFLLNLSSVLIAVAHTYCTYNAHNTKDSTESITLFWRYLTEMGAYLARMYLEASAPGYQMEFCRNVKRVLWEYFAVHHWIGLFCCFIQLLVALLNHYIKDLGKAEIYVNIASGLLIGMTTLVKRTPVFVLVEGENSHILEKVGMEDGKVMLRRIHI